MAKLSQRGDRAFRGPTCAIRRLRTTRLVESDVSAEGMAGMIRLAVKLPLTPTVAVVAGLAGRRWGAAVGGAVRLRRILSLARLGVAARQRGRGFRAGDRRRARHAGGDAQTGARRLTRISDQSSSVSPG
jgi:hypothetical protein